MIFVKIETSGKAISARPMPQLGDPSPSVRKTIAHPFMGGEAPPTATSRVPSGTKESGCGCGRISFAPGGARYGLSEALDPAINRWAIIRRSVARNSNGGVGGFAAALILGLAHPPDGRYVPRTERVAPKSPRTLGSRFDEPRSKNHWFFLPLCGESLQATFDEGHVQRRLLMQLF